MNSKARFNCSLLCGIVVGKIGVMHFALRVREKIWHAYGRSIGKNDKVIATKQVQHHPALANMEQLAKLLDAQFKIPGTNIRFGLDAILGLIPGVGDFGTFAVSGYMLTILAKNGASGFVMARMVLNILIDALFGSIPLVGDLFDVYFKANLRNMKLMQEHFQEGRHRGSAWKVIVPVLLGLFLVIAGLCWLSYQFIKWLWEFFVH